MRITATLVVVIALVFVAVDGIKPEPDWALQLGGAGKDEGLGVVISSKGDIYACGSFSFDFIDKTGINGDAFTVKYVADSKWVSFCLYLCLCLCFRRCSSAFFFTSSLSSLSSLSIYLPSFPIPLSPSLSLTHSLSPFPSPPSPPTPNKITFFPHSLPPTIQSLSINSPHPPSPSPFTV